ncbi:putative reverse transcriptase domain-containing protein [Tanacetum coccineum]
MVIEMADRSIQSPKGMVENVLVKIHKFIFLVDFVILDIIEYEKFLIILGRPMLATTHARIDMFGGKISLIVGKEQIIFNANEGATPVIVSSDLRQAVVLFEPGMLDFHELVLMDDLVPSVIIGTVIYSSTPLMSELEIEFPDLCGEVLVIVHLDHWISSKKAQETLAFGSVLSLEAQEMTGTHQEPLPLVQQNFSICIRLMIRILDVDWKHMHPDFRGFFFELWSLIFSMEVELTLKRQIRVLPLLMNLPCFDPAEGLHPSFIIASSYAIKAFPRSKGKWRRVGRFSQQSIGIRGLLDSLSCGAMRAFEQKTRDMDVEFIQVMSSRLVTAQQPRRDYVVTNINEGLSQNYLYGVKTRPLYAVTIIIKEDNLSKSTLPRNIGDKVTP